MRAKTEQFNPFLLLMAIVAIFISCFLPGIFITIILFSISYSSPKRWYFGLAGFAVCILLFWTFSDVGLVKAYENYLLGFFPVLFRCISSGNFEQIMEFWKKNIFFITMNGFLFGSIFSAIWRFTRYDIRDLRETQKSAWLKNLGIDGKRGESTEKTESRGALSRISSLPHPENGTLVGLQKRKKIVITDAQANAHILVLGATGSGKTTTLLNFVESAAQRQLPLIAVDAKGDPEFAGRVGIIAERYHRAFRMFSTRAESSMKYDPLKNGNALELVDKIMAASDWSEPHYEFEARNFLQMAFSILLAGGRRPNLANMADCLDISSLSTALRNIADEEKAEKLEKMLENYDYPPQGLLNRLATWSGNELSHLFSSSIGGMDLPKIIENNEIAVFSLDTLRYPEFSRQLGRLITLDLKNAVSRTYENRKKTYVLLDEFGSFANMHITDFINKSRGAGFHILVATQEIIDLDLAVEGLADVILGNTNIKIVHRQDIPKSAELLAATIGTKQDFSITHRIGGGEKSGTITKERAFIVHPDEIKRLSVGQAYICVKTPDFEVFRASIRQIGREENKENKVSDTLWNIKKIIGGKKE